jgi:hypothetical protein
MQLYRKSSLFLKISQNPLYFPNRAGLRKFLLANSRAGGKLTAVNERLKWLVLSGV